MDRDMRPVKLEEIEAKMSPEQRARVDKLHAEMRAEELTLAEVRKAREMTQTALARKLGKTQAHVSRIESAGDLFISTLRKQVEALGGDLDLRVTFPDMAPVSIAGFKELTPHPFDANVKLADPLEGMFKDPEGAAPVKKVSLKLRFAGKHASAKAVGVKLSGEKQRPRSGRFRVAASKPKHTHAAKRG